MSPDQLRTLGSHAAKIGADDVVLERLHERCPLLLGKLIPMVACGFLAHGGDIERPGEKGSDLFAGVLF